MKKYEIWDDLVVLEFEGDLIGHSTSRKDDKRDQWTEISIYKTRAGKYVVQIEGKSVRYHRVDAPCASGKRIKGSEIGEDSMDCPKCLPLVPEDEEFDPEEEFVHEITWSRANVVENPKDIRETLLQKNKETGKKFLSAPSFSAIQDAIQHDPSLVTIFERRQRVD